MMTQSSSGDNFRAYTEQIAFLMKSQMEQTFSEFSEFKESDKSLKHEFGSI